MYYIVHFHADGGQMCVPGLRCFEDPVKAARFADKQRNVPGHTCQNSVREEISETPVKPFGIPMNEVEMMHPEMFTTKEAPIPRRRKGFLSRVASVIFGGD